MKDKFNDGFFNFINSATSCFNCIDSIKNKLIKEGYIQVYENEKWNFKSGKYFVIRNDASIIAFNIGINHKEGFNIVCTHSDTPDFIIKPKNNIYENNYLKLNVAPHGGILNYSWMDRPLSISGRIIYKDKNNFNKKIIDLEEALCVIPSEAIHLNDCANNNLNLNTQIDMIPVISLNADDNIIKNILSKKYNIDINSICDYDLFLYSLDKPMYIGTNREMILSPRIDDLSCTYATLKSFIESDNDENINIMCVFNSEEVGSLTMEGADSSFLIDTLRRICSSIGCDIYSSLYNSLVVCADNSHAVHPNHPDKSDINNYALLNKGIIISREKDTSTDGVSSSIFKSICDMANVLYQDITSRNDMCGGSTLSGLSIRHVSTNSIDIGIAQLAMHSANEIVGSDDIFYLYNALSKFYNVSIINNFDGFELIENNSKIESQ